MTAPDEQKVYEQEQSRAAPAVPRRALLAPVSGLGEPPWRARAVPAGLRH